MGIFSTDNNILYCKVCNKKISSEKRFSVIQHIATEKHHKAVERVEKKKMINLYSFCYKTQQNRYSNLIYIKLC
jgi:hypothetical protein